MLKKDQLKEIQQEFRRRRSGPGVDEDRHIIVYKVSDVAGREEGVFAAIQKVGIRGYLLDLSESSVTGAE